MKNIVTCNHCGECLGEGDAYDLMRAHKPNCSGFEVKCPHGGYCDYDGRPETLTDCSGCSRHYENEEDI